VLSEGLDPRTTPLARVMTHTPTAIAPDRPFGHALHLMFEGGFRHVPVVEGGKLIGIVSAHDALSSDLAKFESDLAEREHIAEIL
jgi:CBS domain-containing protein